MRKTQGAKQLATWRKRNDYTLQMMADYCKVTRSAAHAWLSGISKPSLTHCIKIEKLTRIKVQNWI